MMEGLCKVRLIFLVLNKNKLILVCGGGENSNFKVRAKHRYAC